MSAPLRPEIAQETERVLRAKFAEEWNYVAGDPINFRDPWGLASTGNTADEGRPADGVGDDDEVPVEETIIDLGETVVTGKRDDKPRPPRILREPFHRGIELGGGLAIGVAQGVTPGGSLAPNIGPGPIAFELGRALRLVLGASLQAYLGIGLILGAGGGSLLGALASGGALAPAAALAAAAGATVGAGLVAEATVKIVTGLSNISQMASKGGAKSGSGEEPKYKAPKPGVSGKEGAKDVPSWAKGERPLVGENGKGFAKRLLDAKYGDGNYKTGPGSEYSQLRKYGDRSFVDPE